MNKEVEKKIIDEFVNSDNFAVISNYISKPYEETIDEMEEKNTNLKQVLNDIKEYIEPIIELDTCTLKGTMLKPILKEIDKVLGD